MQEKGLRVDESGVLFASGDYLNQKTVKKLRKSAYGKDKILFNLYNEFISNDGNKNVLKEQIVINTPFVQEHASYQRGDMLYSIDGPMQLIHADLADLNFLVNLLSPPPTACFVSTYFHQKFIRME